MNIKRRKQKGPNIVFINIENDLFLGDKVLMPSYVYRAEERREFVVKMEKVFAWPAILFEITALWLDDLVWWVGERLSVEKT